MNFNLVQLLEQLKKFMQQENGSWFSLFLYIIVGLTIGDRVVGRLLAYEFPKTQSYIVGGCIIGLSIILRFFTRIVQTKKGKINIGIADLLIIYMNENALTPMTYDIKSQLASETAQYLYSQIQGEMYDGSANKMLNLIKLPSRIQVTFENDRNMAEELGLDVLVRGTLKFIEGKYYLNYKLTFSKKLESWAFNEVIQSISGYPDIEFDLHGKTEDIQLFIHQLIWVSTLLAVLRDITERKFLSSFSLISDLIKRIKESNWHDNPTNHLIQYLAYFIGMRNLLSMQDRLDKNKIKDILQGEWIQQGVQTMFAGLSDSLKSYFSVMKRDLIHDEQFEIEFLYAMSNNPNKEWTDDASFVDSQKDLQPWTKDLLSGYFSLIHEDLIDAKIHYNSVIMQDPDNMIALRSLGIVEYKLGNYVLANQYLSEYDKNSNQHVFFTHYVDVKILKLLSFTNRHCMSPFAAIAYYLRYLKGIHKNKNISKRYVIV